MDQQGIPSYGGLLYEEDGIEHILAKGPVILTEFQAELQNTITFGSQGFREYTKKPLKKLKSGVMQVKEGELLDNPLIIHEARIQTVRLRWTTKEGEKRENTVNNLAHQGGEISFDFPG